MRRIKICMSVNFLPDLEHSGGVSYQVHYFANKLHDNGIDVTVFSSNKPNLKYSYKVKIVKYSHWIAKRKILWFLLYPVLLRMNDYRDFDLFHSHGDEFLFFFFSKPIIRTFYGSALGEFNSASSFKRKLNQIFRYFTEYISGFHAKINVGISHSTKKYLPFINKVIPCGINLEKFKPDRVKSEHPSIFFVGTIKGRKRGWFLVKVFKEEIKPKIPDAELWIVSSEKVSGDGIFWFGRVSESKLIELYQRAWIFCLPSRYEGFGVPYIEAMACGTTVVTTPNQGAIEVLQNGEYGFIVSDENLHYTLIELIKDNTKRNRIRKKCLEYVKKYAITNVAKRYKQIYYRMVGTRDL